MYSNDKTWQEMQSYLPSQNRLLSNNLPNEYYYSVGKVNIHIDHYKVDNPKAVLVLFHGVGGNGRILSFIASPLQKQGYEIICPDLPLYGYTKYNGTISYDDWVECGIKIVEQFHKKDIPIFVFGLSAGGMLAYQVACEYNVDGIIATCLLDQRIPTITKSTAIHPVVAIVSKPLLKILHKPLGNMKIPMKMVANMKAIVNDSGLAKLLMKDKLSSGTRVSLSFLYTMLNPIIKIEASKFDNCPLLLVHPQEDKWTDVSLSKLFFDKLKCSKELKILKGAGHFPIEEQGLKELENACLEFIKNHTNKNK